MTKTKDVDRAPVHAVVMLPVKAVQIQSSGHPGDTNSGPHIELFALCEDGSIWVQYHSSGFSNVPTDGKWYRCNLAPVNEQRSRCMKCMGTGKSDVEVMGSFDCPWCSR